MDKLDTDRLVLVVAYKNLKKAVLTQWTTQKSLMALAVVGLTTTGIFFSLNQTQKKKSFLPISQY